MAATITPITPATPGLRVAQPQHVFPTLTAAQVERIAAHGRARWVEPGEVLAEPGQVRTHFFVVRSGWLEVVARTRDADMVVAVHRPGQFAGEVNMLSGRPSMFLLRAGEAGEVIQVSRD